MKRFIHIILVVSALLVASCTKVTELSKYPFSIEIKRVQAKAAWVDVTPQTNEFHYYSGVAKMSEYKGFASDEQFVVSVDARLRREYRESGAFVSFKSKVLYSGAYCMPFAGLEPETEYIAFAYSYDSSTSAMPNLVTVPFTTPSYNPSDITFDLSFNGSFLKLVPSNNDPYFWDCDFTSVIDNDFGGDIKTAFYSVINLYWEYDFLPGCAKSGPETYDMYESFRLAPGDQFYIAVSGFDNGINSPIYKYKATYKGDTLPGEVEFLGKE